MSDTVKTILKVLFICAGTLLFGLLFLVPVILYYLIKPRKPVVVYQQAQVATAGYTTAPTKTKLVTWYDLSEYQREFEVKRTIENLLRKTPCDASHVNCDAAGMKGGRVFEKRLHVTPVIKKKIVALTKKHAIPQAVIDSFFVTKTPMPQK